MVRLGREKMAICEQQSRGPNVLDLAKELSGSFSEVCGCFKQYLRYVSSAVCIVHAIALLMALSECDSGFCWEFGASLFNLAAMSLYA